MEQQSTQPPDMQKLREQVFSDPPTQEIRDDLTTYVLTLVDKARKLPKDELLSEDGQGIAMDICGALAWNYYSGEAHDNDGWFTKESDPAFDEILLYASPLDVDANDFGSWEKLFAAADKLLEKE